MSDSEYTYSYVTDDDSFDEPEKSTVCPLNSCAHTPQPSECDTRSNAQSNGKSQISHIPQHNLNDSEVDFESSETEEGEYSKQRSGEHRVPSMCDLSRSPLQIVSEDSSVPPLVTPVSFKQPSIQEIDDDVGQSPCPSLPNMVSVVHSVTRNVERPTHPIPRYHDNTHDRQQSNNYYHHRDHSRHSRARSGGTRDREPRGRHRSRGSRPVRNSNMKERRINYKKVGRRSPRHNDTQHRRHRSTPRRSGDPHRTRRPPNRQLYRKNDRVSELSPLQIVCDFIKQLAQNRVEFIISSGQYLVLDKGTMMFHVTIDGVPVPCWLYGFAEVRSQYEHSIVDFKTVYYNILYQFFAMSSSFVVVVRGIGPRGNVLLVDITGDNGMGISVLQFMKNSLQTMMGMQQEQMENYQCNNY